MLFKKTYTNEYCASKYTSLEKAAMVLTLSIFIYLPIVLQCVFLPNAESRRLKFNGTANIQTEAETAETSDISICGTPQAIASICANLSMS